MLIEHASSSETQRIDWRMAHENLSRLAKRRAGLDWEEGRALLDALRSGVHLHLGLGAFGEYVERVLGYGRRSTDERLRVAEALEGLPEMSRALRDGNVSWSIVRELTRMATSENEGEWLEVARGKTVREVEEMVARREGDRKRALRFEVSGETFAAFGEAMAKLRREAGERLDDDAALLLLARKVLGGSSDEGRASYQVALTVCEECGRGWQEGRNERVEVGAEIVEMAQCDSQEVPMAHVGRARQGVPPAVRRLVMRRDGGRCVVPGCRQGTFVDVHHVTARADGGDHDPNGLVVLCCAHHRAVHRGQLIVEGRVATGLAFRHADGTVYGEAPMPSDVAIHEEAFRALRAMGFRESEVRRGLGVVRGAGSVEGALRQALAWLAGPHIE